jgi:archaemetzincin
VRLFSRYYTYLILVAEAENFINPGELEKHLVKEFGLPLKRLKSPIDPEQFYDPRRKQYHSTEILKTLLKDFPEDAARAIGIVPFDLYIPILTFVFGEAQVKGKVGIVSMARLRQEFYGLPPNEPLFHRRLIKEVKHELGHTLGLVHCSLRECVMSLANNIVDVDSKGLTFCENCREQLRSSRW